MGPTNEPPSGAVDDPGELLTPPTPANRESRTALKNWATVMGHLMVQHLDYDTKAGRASLFFMLAEPLILIGLFYLIRGVARGMVSQYGDSLFLFLASGILPFYLFLRTSTLTRRSQLQPGRRLPRINSMDLFIAITATNALIWLVVIGFLFVGMWMYGIKQAIPVSIGDCGIALFLLVIAGGGLALIHSAIARYFPAWLAIIRYSTRGLLFFSGVIHIADFYPPYLRTWLVWNPILHGVDWFRLGVYGRYPTLVLDEFYLVKTAVILLFIGIVADRATLRHGGR